MEASLRSIADEPEAEKETVETEYVILESVAEPAPGDPTADWRWWVEVGTVKAAGQRQALSRFYDGKTPKAELYVAVPARSFRPMQVVPRPGVEVREPT